MEVNIKVPEYSSVNGLRLEWEDNFEISSSVENNTVTITATITANKEGLISLAKHLLTLAQVEVPTGSHIHLDDINSLETNSVELIFEKI